MHASLLWSSGLMVMQVQVALNTTYSTAVVPNAIDRSAEGRRTRATTVDGSDMTLRIDSLSPQQAEFPLQCRRRV